MHRFALSDHLCIPLSLPCRPTLWKENWNSRIVVNFELAIQFELHGILPAVRSLPGIAGALLKLRPTDALHLASTIYHGKSTSPRRRGGIDGDEWHRLASRMDTELDHIGAAKLLDSHTPHESCVRTPPTEGRPLLSISVISLQSSAVLSKVPLARPLERLVNAGLTTALRTVDRFLPEGPSARLGLRARKSKTD